MLAKFISVVEYKESMKEPSYFLLKDFKQRDASAYRFEMNFRQAVVLYDLDSPPTLLNNSLNILAKHFTIKF
jgi:hypothetical protein